jgi:hypothetical protein
MLGCPMNLPALDVSLRAASAAWLLLAALLLWRGHAHLLAGRLGALFDDAFRGRRRHATAWTAFAATGLQ